MAYSPLPVTSSLQDYLETILSLSSEDRGVRVTDIAQRLNIAKASVTQALTILKEQGLVEQDYYGPVRLTSRGREYAGKVRYRHAVISFFLKEILKVKLVVAEKDACSLEHILSEETFEALQKFLEEQNIYPRFTRDRFCD